MFRMYHSSTHGCSRHRCLRQWLFFVSTTSFLESQPPLVPLVRQQAYQCDSANLQDYYEELGVSKTADKAEIKSGKEPYSHAGKQ
jgi:hypothetical protein